jgi:hypothetical protein
VLAHEVAQLHPQLVPRLAPHAHEVLPVEQLSELEGGLAHAADGEQEVDVLLRALRLELHVPPVHAHRRLLDRALLGELDEELPDGLVLRDGQRPQRAVKLLAGDRRAVLPEEELEVVQPDAWHLVHRHQRSLVRAVEVLDRRVLRPPV